MAPARGGPLDLVRPERTGLLYQPDEHDSLTAAVRRLVKNPALRAVLASRGLAQVSSRSWAHLVDELVTQHYLGAIGHGDTAASAVLV